MEKSNSIIINDLHQEIQEYEDSTIRIIFDNYDILSINKNSIELIPKILKIKKISNLSQFCFNKSKILECKLNNNNPSLKYANILQEIYHIIGDKTKIKENSLLNIKLGKEDEKGFCYLSRIGISFQRADANKTLKEIYHQCEKNKIKIYLKIELANQRCIIVER